MADSSLSEEMSQFDFSTGVQSFSYNSQNPTGHQGRSRARVREKQGLFVYLQRRVCLCESEI